MNRLRMCEFSGYQALNRHPRIIKSPPESLGTRLTARVNLLLLTVPESQQE